MKKSLFKSRYYLKILFSNNTIDKTCWMVGFGLFTLTLCLYILLITTIVSIFNSNVNSQAYYSLLKSILIFAILSLFFGTKTSMWLIFAFSNKKRLLLKKKLLMVICLMSLNFIGYYFLNYLLENFLETEKHFSAVLLTNEHVLNKKNKIWQVFLIFFSIFSIFTFFPMLVLTCWLSLESQYVYLEESEIRDRIGLTFESLFCLFPIFSIVSLISTIKNKLFIAWLGEIALDQEEQNFNQNKNGWSKSLNILIWFFYWGTFFSFLLWVSVIMVLMIIDVADFNNDNFLIWFVWPLTTLFILYFDIYKKYLFELNKKIPLWILVFEILTLNILMMTISLMFIYKNNSESNQNQNSHWKVKLDKNFFWLILLNTLLAYSLIIVSIILFQIRHYQDINLKIVVVLITSGVIFLIDLILNIWKMTNYKVYFNNLIWWFLIDLISLNLLGLIFNLMSKSSKDKLVAQLFWI